jgi:hypothetical protein
LPFLFHLHSSPPFTFMILLYFCLFSPLAATSERKHGILIFWDWLIISLNMLISSSTHFPMNNIISFFLMVE